MKLDFFQRKNCFAYLLYLFSGNKIKLPIFSILYLGFLVSLAFPRFSHGFGSNITTCTPPISIKKSAVPVVITTCTETDLRDAITSGGHITFDCGTNPTTIKINASLELNTEVDTVIDGGGLITIDGQDRTRLFHKGWHNGFDITITFQNIRMINGKAPAKTDTNDEHSGGAFYGGHPGTRIHIINSTFEDNSTQETHTADNQGGAFFVHNSYETVITGSEFTSNEAGNGGAMGGIATGLYVFNSRFDGNKAVDDSIVGVVKGHGGAIHLDGVTSSYNPDSDNRVHICGSVFLNNTSIRGGGALKVTVSDNKGTLATYEKSTFLDNIVSGSSEIEGHGGAIYHIEDDRSGGSKENNIELHQCLFNNNSSWRQGGGAWFSVLGYADIVNNTFVGNNTVDNELGMGGGLVISDGKYNVINNTFAANYAWFHGAAIQASNSADFTLLNTLFVSNESGREWACYQTNRSADHDGGGNFQFPVLRYNQPGSVADCLVSSNARVEDPYLESLADNDGPNETMALTSNSPAVGGGTSNNAPLIDQRGYERKLPLDSGAFQFNSWPPVGLIEIISVLQICAGMHPEISELKVIDIDSNQKYGLQEVLYILQIMAKK